MFGQFRAGLKPDPKLTVSEWADEYRFLSSRVAAEPGRYRSSRVPYMRQIMDSMSPSSASTRVVFIKPSQVGATEAGLNLIGFVISQAPGPMLAVQPTVETAKRFSVQRIDDLANNTPAVQAKLPSNKSRDGGNTAFSKNFPGGLLILTGANSATGLRSMPARYLFLDEVDAYPVSVDDEGDPVQLAEARTMTFGHRRKVFIASTPTVQGASRIEREFEISDQRHAHVPCPHCEHYQFLSFANLHWDEGRPQSAHYVCEDCGSVIEEHHKTWMLANLEYVSYKESDDGVTEGYKINALYSPVGWLSWAEIARQWENAKTEDAQRVFYNTILAETWAEKGEAPEWERLAERREVWTNNLLPRRALFLTAGVDIQGDRIEASVYGWGRGLERFWIGHYVFSGDINTDEPWEKLRDFLGWSWAHETGVQMTLAKVAIDAGTYTDKVYSFVRKQDQQTVFAVKGNEGFNRSVPVSGPTYVDVNEGGVKRRRGVQLWIVATNTFKSETYGALRKRPATEEEVEEGNPEYPDGFFHIPKWIEDERLKQLVAEQLVTTKDRRGYTKLEWQKKRDRNEALDCAVYARAAAYRSGIDFFEDFQWKQLEQQLGETTVEEPEDVTDDAAGDINSARRRPRRAGQQGERRKRRGSWFGSDDRVF